MAEPGTGPLLFLHIRRAAGTSVTTLVSHRFPVDACLLQAHHRVNAAKDPNRYAFVSGQIGLDYLQRFVRRPVLFTVLRHPVERAISNYSFYRARRLTDLEARRHLVGDERHEFTRRAIEGMQAHDLAGFLRSEPELASAMLGNYQTRMLAGETFPFRGRDDGAELLDRARENLARFDVVGLVERLDESIAWLCEQLEWPTLGPVPHDNQAPLRPARDAVPATSLAMLSELTSVDQQLYSFAEQLHRQRWPGVSPGRPPSVVPRAALMQAENFTFDQPIHGGGWYRREHDGERWFCWMGTDSEAWLDLRQPAGGDRILRCEIAHVLDPRILGGLDVRVNGRPVPLTISIRGRLAEVEGRVPAAAVEGDSGRVRVSFRVSESVRPRAADPLSMDHRALGVALSRVALSPVRRYRGSGHAFLRTLLRSSWARLTR